MEQMDNYILVLLNTQIRFFMYAACIILTINGYVVVCLVQQFNIHAGLLNSS
jgi:hypothetical protein